MNKKPLYLFLCFVWLVGCQTINYPPTDISGVIISSSVTPHIATITKTYTEFSMPYTPTHPIFTKTPTAPTPTRTPQGLPLNNMNQLCINIIQEIRAGDLSEGRIIVRDLRDFTDLPWGLAYVNSGNVIPIQLKDIPSSFEEFATSPNQTELAYDSINENEDDEHQLVVTDYSGQVKAKMRWDYDWNRIVGWIDDQHLILTHIDLSWKGVYLVNPFTGETNILSPQLPDIFPTESALIPPLMQHQQWEMLFDPTFTKVAFNQQKPGQSTEFVIWDLSTNTEIFRLGIDAYYDWPVWTSDWSQLGAIVRNRPEDDFARYQLFVVDWRGGSVEWIDIKGKENVGYGMEAWSPDGRYIAIGGSPLLILDMNTRQVWDTCLASSSFNLGQDNLIWSPDSRQLIVATTDKPSFVIDVEKGTAWRLNPDPKLWPVAWLIAP